MRAMGMKIFGIGLSKTGTTSLARALEMLGYKTKDYPGIETYRAGDLSSVDLTVVDAHDALTDTPIPSFFRELDGLYPGSKFILTVRDRDGWLKSCKKQFTRRLADKQTEAHNQLFMDLYGSVVFDEQKFGDGYEQFLTRVFEYFKDRPHDLLVIDVAAGEGWEKLCPFLGQPVPEIPFPKANVTQITWMDIGDIVSVARRAGREVLKAYQRGGTDRVTDQTDTSGRGAGAGISNTIAKAVYALRGGDAGALKRASRAAHREIVAGLRKLNAQIPILSRESESAPYSERASWNHVWLVDPLDGMDAFLGADGMFTVNIALVQDRVPIYGVVYAPLSDTVYYARIGKGAFRIEGTAEPKRLGSGEDGESKTGMPAPPGGGRKAHNEQGPVHGSHAWAICLVAEGRAKTHLCESPTPEWRTAAAHVIATAAGRRVSDCRSKQALTYNNKDLVSECFIAE